VRAFEPSTSIPVLTPEAAAIVKDVFDPSREAMLRFSSEATRIVNRKQAETIRVQLTSVETRLREMDKMGSTSRQSRPRPMFLLGKTEARSRGRASCEQSRRGDRCVPLRPLCVGLGMMPLRSPRLAITELDRFVSSSRQSGVKGLPWLRINKHKLYS
jgi:hypothetical protein